MPVTRVCMYRRYSNASIRASVSRYSGSSGASTVPTASGGVLNAAASSAWAASANARSPPAASTTSVPPPATYWASAARWASVSFTAPVPVQWTNGSPFNSAGSASTAAASGYSRWLFVSSAASRRQAPGSGSQLAPIFSRPTGNRRTPLGSAMAGLVAGPVAAAVVVGPVAGSVPPTAPPPAPPPPAPSAGWVAAVTTGT